MTSKDHIRSEILKNRDAIPPQVRRAKGSAIKERLFSLREFKEAKKILFYASFKTEVETSGMIADSLSTGKKVMLPKVDMESSSLKIYEITGLEELQAGYMGIPEPASSPDKLRAADDADLVVMPGAAFDEHGGRLGYGKGYYDKMLSGMKKETLLIALAYEEQITGEIPIESHDTRVDAIITDTRVIWTGKR
ncbi:MAG: 5-formyltetrahydrofolate cyclo-ligase [Thermodesulfovibrionales bacterium]|nr:5-formyltetrahydrofolate cyclo-ligase [Thermodesulfovibrionales bacterium]